MLRMRDWFLTMLEPLAINLGVFDWHLKIRNTSSSWPWFLPWGPSEPLPWWSDGSPCLWSLCAVWSSSCLLLGNSSMWSCGHKIHAFRRAEVKKKSFVCTWEEGVVEHGVGDIGSCADLRWHLKKFPPNHWLVVVLRHSTCRGRGEAEIQTLIYCYVMKNWCVWSWKLEIPKCHWDQDHQDDGHVILLLLVNYHVCCYRC